MEVPHRRIDLTDLKNRLFLVLKEKAQGYWDVLRKFLTAKLTRAEMDRHARAVLTPEHIHLHNTFLLSILANAHCPTPPPLPINASPGRGSASQLDTSTLKLRISKSRVSKKIKGVSQPSKIPRARVSKGKGITAAHQRRVGGSVALSNSILNRRLRGTSVIRLQGTRNASSVQYSENDLHFAGEPRLLALRRRMLKTVCEHDLREVSGDAVRFMMDAMEQHLTGILASCNPHDQEKRSVLSTVEPEPVQTDYTLASETNICPATTIPTPTKNRSCAMHYDIVTCGGLWEAVSMRPFLLGENLPIHQERIALMQEGNDLSPIW